MNILKKLWKSMDINSKKEEERFREFSEDNLSKEKWIEHHFKITLNKKGITNKEFEKDINKLSPEVLNIVLSNMIIVDSYKPNKKTWIYQKSLRKNPTIKVMDEYNNPYFLIRFVDSIEEEDKKFGGGMVWKDKSRSPNRSYLFSPYESLLGLKILPQIQLALMGFLGLEPHKDMTYLYIEDSKPKVRGFNGLQYYSYPLEKRFKLAKKYPEIDKLLFGLDLNKFLKWILEKRENSNHMKKYCKKVEELMEKII